MMVPRKMMACGYVKAESGQRYIVLAGGSNGGWDDFVEVVEMLSLDNPTEWVIGPPLPILPPMASKSFQYQDTFLVTGGWKSDIGGFNSVLEFGRNLEWTARNSLNRKRWAHAVFNIPDSWAKCY